MIRPIDTRYPLNDRDFDYNSQELTTLQLLSKIVPVVNDVVAETNLVDGKISEKEDKSAITINRKLSPNGNFTGTVNGRAANLITGGIDSNRDKISYLVGQFNSGQTGQIIDGGFFTDTGIRKNYDGGAF